MKSVSRAGVKLWAPLSIVKFGCLVHDVQLSSRARRICRMVSESSIQIVMFASPVSLLMVFVMVWSICMRVERRRWPQTQTSSLPVVFQLVSLLPQALPASTCTNNCAGHKHCRQLSTGVNTTGNAYHPPSTRQASPRAVDP